MDGLPEGLEFDPETGIISGTPEISDWADGETSRDYTVTIEATDEAGNTSSYTFNIIIERDLSGTANGGVVTDGTKGSDLPATGETQNVITSALGILMAAVGGLFITLDKKRESLINKFKKN